MQCVVWWEQSFLGFCSWLDTIQRQIFPIFHGSFGAGNKCNHTIIDPQQNTDFRFGYKVFGVQAVSLRSYFVVDTRFQ